VKSSPTAGPIAAVRRFLRHPLAQRVIRNSGYLLGAQTTAAGLSMLQGILAARLLGVEGLGLLGVITQFSSVINRLTSFRMGELVISYVSRFAAQGDTRRPAAVFKAAGIAELVSSAAAFGILAALAPWAARTLAHRPAVADEFILYGLVLLANGMAESSTGLLQVFNRYRTLAVLTAVQSVITLGLIAVGFVRGADLPWVVFAYLVGKAAWALGVTAAAVRQATREWGAGWWRAPLSVLDPTRRELIRFAFSTNLSASLNLVTRDSEVLWLGAFSTPLQVGYYKVALAVINILLIPVTPLITTTYREVAREVGERQWANVRYLLRSGTLLAASWTLPATLGLALFGPWVIRLYGPEFAPAYPMLLVLLGGAAVANLLYWNRAALLPLGLPDFPTKVLFVAALLKIVGILLFVPAGGGVAMAWLLTLFFIGSAAVLVWRTLRELRRAEMRFAAASVG
jgi:O-antigen/teichoic acid export membrane protein